MCSCGQFGRHGPATRREDGPVLLELKRPFRDGTASVANGAAFPSGGGGGAARVSSLALTTAIHARSRRPAAPTVTLFEGTAPTIWRCLGYENIRENDLVDVRWLGHEEPMAVSAIHGSGSGNMAASLPQGRYRAEVVLRGEPLASNNHDGQQTSARRVGLSFTRSAIYRLRGTECFVSGTTMCLTTLRAWSKSSPPRSGPTNEREGLARQFVPSTRLATLADLLRVGRRCLVCQPTGLHHTRLHHTHRPPAGGWPG